MKFDPRLVSDDARYVARRAWMALRDGDSKAYHRREGDLEGLSRIIKSHAKYKATLMKKHVRASDSFPADVQYLQDYGLTAEEAAEYLRSKSIVAVSDAVRAGDSVHAHLPMDEVEESENGEAGDIDIHDVEESEYTMSDTFEHQARQGECDRGRKELCNDVACTDVVLVGDDRVPVLTLLQVRCIR